MRCIAAITESFGMCPVEDRLFACISPWASSFVSGTSVHAGFATPRIPDFVEPWAQMTIRLNQALQAIGLATSGRLGMRLAARLGIPISWMTILRRIMALASPESTSVTVLGIDDFSFQRGRRFGTILVDLQRHQMIELLDERSPESSANWMRGHPEMNYVSRDRGKEYARSEPVTGHRKRRKSPTAFTACETSWKPWNWRLHAVTGSSATRTIPFPLLMRRCPMSGETPLMPLRNNNGWRG